MSGANGKKASAGPSSVVEWISTACRFATDRNDFRRCVEKGGLLSYDSEANYGPMNLLVNLGLFVAGVWVARNLSDFDLMSPQPVT